MPDGTIIVRAKAKSILDMAGMLEAPKDKRVSVEESLSSISPLFNFEWVTYAHREHGEGAVG
jgi:hypothetical protein